ncbi:XPB/Ssl2-like helicase family protein [Salana multivorans]|uniref:XPB/Ssl2-like helicase family protein n=1 Tax=Salana multivorans TaxID=120377 RepID=A0A3N2D8H7_9MICO|nr:helicase-associated domain-containing protein [Salana multivorans]ROR95948.1 XPB/Ssl2-like helicase family protein [Salana multivorans]
MVPPQRVPQLATWSDAQLADLLRLRPDLAAPLPGSLATLAERASTSRSLTLALHALDTPRLALLASLADGATGASDAATSPASIADLAARGLVVPDEDAPAGWSPARGLPETLATLRAQDGTLLDPAQATPPLADAPALAESVVDAEAARAATTLLRRLTALADLWTQQPGVTVRTGGVAVREVRRVARALDLDEADVVRLVELAGIGGEVGLREHGDDRAWAPLAPSEVGASREGATGVDRLAGTRRPDEDADDDADDLRWARVVLAWWWSDRAPALAGTVAPDGSRRAPLGDGLDRAWARRLRRRVLEALAAWPAGAAPDAEAVRAHLAWHSPLLPPPLGTVRAVLAEAAMLGLTGAGSLAPTGRALLADPDGPELATALRGLLPASVDRVLLQGDLTAVVPGRPAPAVARLLRLATEIESTGDAVTARFTPASLERAVASGVTARELLADLADLSLTPVPQALEYAVRDAERRQGGLRAGPASSYLRAEDPVALLGLVEADELGLLLLAPTVAVSTLPAAHLATLLGGMGRPVVVEGPGGQVLDLHRPPPARQPRWLAPGRGAGTAVGQRDTTALVAALRESEELIAARGDAADVAGALRAAVAGRQEVEIEIVASDGARSRRLVRPLRLSGGSLVARDLTREADVTVALHRVASVDQR